MVPAPLDYNHVRRGVDQIPVFRDGPLTRKPPETIRYGTGRCALGALLRGGRLLVRALAHPWPGKNCCSCGVLFASPRGREGDLE